LTFGLRTITFQHHTVATSGDRFPGTPDLTIETKKIGEDWGLIAFPSDCTRFRERVIALEHEGASVGG